MRLRTPGHARLGFMLRSVDAGNDDKLELVADGTFDRDPGDGAGSLFSLVRVKDGIEEILTQVPAK